MRRLRARSVVVGDGGQGQTDAEARVPAWKRWAVKKDDGDFDQLTGATITPGAILAARCGGLERFATHRDRLTDSAMPVVCESW